MLKPALWFVLLGFATQSFSADIVRVSALTNQILLVQFDEGSVAYHKAGQPRSNSDKVTVVPLNLTNALAINRYALRSTDDANYAQAVSPVDIGRKTKVTETAWLCQGWDNATGCLNTSPDHVKEHWIYLFLPTPLVSGKTYTLNTGNLAANGETWTIVYDENTQRSEAVHVNQIGYAPDATLKFGYVYHWLGDKADLNVSTLTGREFYLYDVVSRQRVFTGKAAFRRGKTNRETGQATDTPNQNFAGADVYECDFSAFGTPGQYRLAVSGIGCSFDFVIHKGAYNEPFYHAIRSLYHNRSGIALEAPNTAFTRPAPHRPGVTPGFSGRLKYSTFPGIDAGDADQSQKARIEAGAKGALTDTWGWYQDAGDWDGYYSHSHIPAWLLLLTDNEPGKFRDGDLRLPESGNGLPDAFDEALWLPRFYQRARAEILRKNWGTGGVPGARVFGDLWGEDTQNGEIGQGSWSDVQRDWYVLGEDAVMSFKYAGLAAHIAYIARQNNWTIPGGIDWAKEATETYDWALRNTRTGEQVAAVRLYAAAALYRLTGTAAYNDRFVAEAPGQFAVPANFDDDLWMAAYLYAALPNEQGNGPLKSQARTLINSAAEQELIGNANARACRWGGNFFFPMLVGQATTPMIGQGVLAYYLNRPSAPAKASEYLNYIRTTADYFLGNNPLNMCWLSGVGERNPTGIFHLDWWYSGQTAVLPGVTPYGPWRSQPIGQYGPWNYMAATRHIHPNVDQWPGHERWFNQRYGILNCEFTVHQNARWTALVYGLLSDGSGIVPTTEPSDAAVGNLPVSAWFDAAAREIVVRNPQQIPLTYSALYSLNGQQVNEQVLPTLTTDLLRLPVGDLPPAIYLLHLHAADGRQQGLRLLLD